MPDDREVAETPEPPLGLFERLRRDVDEVHAPAAPGRLQRLGEHHQLLAAPAAEFDEQRRAIAVPPSARSTTSAACASRRRRSARVMRYHGSRQIASNSDEPSSSYRYLDCSCLGIEREVAPDVRGELGEKAIGSRLFA